METVLRGWSRPTFTYSVLLTSSLTVSILLTLHYREGDELFLIPIVDMINHATDASKRNASLCKVRAGAGRDFLGLHLSLVCPQVWLLSRLCPCHTSLRLAILLAGPPTHPLPVLLQFNSSMRWEDLSGKEHEFTGFFVMKAERDIKAGEQVGVRVGAEGAQF
jgi:hypothetical protein